MLITLSDQGRPDVEVQLPNKGVQQAESNHSHWGNQLSYIDYDCKIPEGSSFVDVVKETFR